MFTIFKNLFSSKNQDLSTILTSNPLLVDVRTPEEFKSGNVKGSINIPVGTVIDNINKFKNKNKIVVFCKSGARSSIAKQILIKNGITNVTNGGTWQKVNELINNINERANF